MLKCEICNKIESLSKLKTLLLQKSFAQKWGLQFSDSKLKSHQFLKGFETKNYEMCFFSILAPFFSEIERLVLHFCLI